MRSALLLALLAAGAAPAQTMLDQEERLIELHSLLIVLEPLAPPGAYRAGELSLGVELLTIPPIDGTTGGKRQITASDRTPVFPRPRAALGLPAPQGFRAMVGLAYIPPVPIRDVSSHLGGLEAAFAWAPDGPFSAGLRAHAVLARSRSPVTEPDTRDTLDTVLLGADAGAGYRLDFEALSVTPFASVGLTRVSGDFTVTSDDARLKSRSTVAGLTVGVRLFARRGFECVAQLTAFPGRMVHPGLSLAWMPDWLARR